MYVVYEAAIFVFFSVYFFLFGLILTSFIGMSKYHANGKCTILKEFQGEFCCFLTSYSVAIDVLFLKASLTKLSNWHIKNLNQSICATDFSLNGLNVYR